MTDNGGRLLLILTSRNTQTAAELATGSQLSLIETLRQLTQLSDQGFVVAVDAAAAPTVYRLSPKPVSPSELDPHQRILLIDDDADVQEIVTTILVPRPRRPAPVDERSGGPAMVTAPHGRRGGHVGTSHHTGGRIGLCRADRVGDPPASEHHPGWAGPARASDLAGGRRGAAGPDRSRGAARPQRRADLD